MWYYVGHNFTETDTFGTETLELTSYPRFQTKQYGK